MQEQVQEEGGMCLLALQGIYAGRADNRQIDIQRFNSSMKVELPTDTQVDFFLHNLDNFTVFYKVLDKNYGIFV